MAAFYGCSAAAFEDMVRRWWEPIVRLFLQRGWSPEEATDLAQEVFLRILQTKDRGAGRCDPTRGRVGTWVRQIASTVAAEQARRRQRRPEGAADEEEPLADQASPSEESAEKEEEERLRWCLAELGEQEREFVEQWEGAFGALVENEIAEQLGVSPAALSRIKQRALEQLRDGMEGGDG
jgi:RNA polymerase sigma factor (sigma-70 family)